MERPPSGDGGGGNPTPERGQPHEKTSSPRSCSRGDTRQGPAEKVPSASGGSSPLPARLLPGHPFAQRPSTSRRPGGAPAGDDAPRPRHGAPGGQADLLDVAAELDWPGQLHEHEVVVVALGVVAGVGDEPGDRPHLPLPAPQRVRPDQHPHDAARRGKKVEKSPLGPSRGDPWARGLFVRARPAPLELLRRVESRRTCPRDPLAPSPLRGEEATRRGLTSHVSSKSSLVAPGSLEASPTSTRSC